MPREISGLRIARSFITPTDTRVSRVIDFQLGARQGIQIEQVIGAMGPDVTGFAISTGVTGHFTATQTLHLEAGSLENVPDTTAEDEDTIDSEVFYRQDLYIGGNDDATTEFRASLAMTVTPSGAIAYPKPILTARNITHSGVALSAALDFTAHVLILYTFVEFSLAELGLILARRT